MTETTSDCPCCGRADRKVLVLTNGLRIIGCECVPPSGLGMAVPVNFEFCIKEGKPED